jgi:putative intracellular protease/amidase
MKHILFIVTSSDKVGPNNHKTGYEFSEIADPYIEFTKARITVDFASTKGGSPPEDGYDENHKNSKLFRNSSGYKRLNFSHRLENVNIELYDAIFFPGGLGPLVDMENNSVLKKGIAKVYENGKIISSVCHGSVALLNVKLTNGKLLLEGRRITSFTEEEEKIKNHLIGEIIPFMLEKALKEQDAIFSKQKPFKNYVVIDGNIITGQNPASAKDVAKAVIKRII